MLRHLEDDYTGAATNDFLLLVLAGCWLKHVVADPLLLIPTLVIIQRHVIGREERYIRFRCGGEYDAYAREVRR